MITVLNGTNRPQNQTQVYAQLYFSILQLKGVNSRYFSLENLTNLHLTNYLELKTEEKLVEIQHKYIKEADKLVIVSPEYNGSYPGILKLFIDACEYKLFKGKKIALVGTSTGRAGNVRGMDHLTNIFHYLEAEVMHYKVPVSGVQHHIKEGKITDAGVADLFHKQIDLFLAF